MPSPPPPPRRPMPHALWRRRQPLAGARQSDPQVPLHSWLGIRQRLPRHDPAQLRRQLAALEEALRGVERGSEEASWRDASVVFCHRRFPLREREVNVDEGAAFPLCNTIRGEWKRNGKDYVTKLNVHSDVTAWTYENLTNLFRHLIKILIIRGFIC